MVTGGNRGIGLAVAQAMAVAGDRVAVTSRSGHAPQGLFTVGCDVSDTDSVESAFDAVEKEQGPVEVLVANAGITQDMLLLQMADEDFTDVLDTNLTGAFRVARRAAAGMLAARWGRLVFISSAVGLMGAPGQANYAASKAGLVGLARSLSWELAPRGITANVVAPGLIETGMTAELTPERREAVLGMIPSRRSGAPAEVAHAVRFLADDAAGYITGAVLPVAGGFGMGH